MSSLGPNARPIVPDATYLVTGGLHGFGLEIARYLAQIGARHLCLVSRSGTPDERAHELLAALRRDGITVDLRAVDVGDEQAVVRLLSELGAKSPPLRGIFHAAGVYEDSLLETQSRERFERVFRPKAEGALWLHTHSRALPIDLFVLLSSVATLIGNPGQAAYAAANAFVDGLAEHRRAMGLPATSLALGPIAEIGVLARTPGLPAALERRGVVPMSVATVLRALGRALGEHPVACTFARIDPSRLFQTGVLRSPRFSSVWGADTIGPSEEGGTRSLLQGSREERLGRVETEILGAVARAVGVPKEGLDPTRSLAEMGIDSLLAAEVGAALSESTGWSIPDGVVMRAKSLRDLILAVEKHVSRTDDAAAGS